MANSAVITVPPVDSHSPTQISPLTPKIKQTSPKTMVLSEKNDVNIKKRNSKDQTNAHQDDLKPPNKKSKHNLKIKNKKASNPYKLKQEKMSDPLKSLDVKNLDVQNMSAEKLLEIQKYIQSQQDLINDLQKKNDKSDGFNANIAYKKSIQKMDNTMKFVPQNSDPKINDDKSITSSNMNTFMNQLKKINESKNPFKENVWIKRFIALNRISNTSDKYILINFVSKNGWKILSNWFNSWYNSWEKSYKLVETSLVKSGNAFPFTLANNRHETPTLEYAFKLLKCCDRLPLTKEDLLDERKVAQNIKKIAEGMNMNIRVLLLIEKRPQYHISKLVTDLKKLAANIFNKWLKIARPSSDGKSVIKSPSVDKVESFKKKEINKNLFNNIKHAEKLSEKAQAKQKMTADAFFMSTNDTSGNVSMYEAYNKNLKKKRKHKDKNKKEKKIEDPNKKRKLEEEKVESIPSPPKPVEETKTSPKQDQIIKVSPPQKKNIDYDEYRLRAKKEEIKISQPSLIPLFNDKKDEKKASNDLKLLKDEKLNLSNNKMLQLPKSKKSVKWIDETHGEPLHSVKYFEQDENERTNVYKQKLADQAEGLFMKTGISSIDEVCDETETMFKKYHCLKIKTTSLAKIPKVIKSKEVIAQSHRELKQLASFNANLAYGSMIESPSEPESSSFVPPPGWGEVKLISWNEIPDECDIESDLPIDTKQTNNAILEPVPSISSSGYNKMNEAIQQNEKAKIQSENLKSRFGVGINTLGRNVDNQKSDGIPDLPGFNSQKMSMINNILSTISKNAKEKEKENHEKAIVQEAINRPVLAPATTAPVKLPKPVTNEHVDNKWSLANKLENKAGAQTTIFNSMFEKINRVKNTNPTNEVIEIDISPPSSPKNLNLSVGSLLNKINLEDKRLSNELKSDRGSSPPLPPHIQNQEQCIVIDDTKSDDKKQISKFSDYNPRKFNEDKKDERTHERNERYRDDKVHQKFTPKYNHNKESYNRDSIYKKDQNHQSNYVYRRNDRNNDRRADHGRYHGKNERYRDDRRDRGENRGRDRRNSNDNNYRKREGKNYSREDRYRDDKRR